MTDHEQYDQVLRELGTLSKLVKALDDSIRGNGGDGLVMRIDRLEGAETRRTRMLWLILGGVVVISVASAKQWLGF